MSHYFSGGRKHKLVILQISDYVSSVFSSLHVFVGIRDDLNNGITGEYGEQTFLSVR
jgi:hypothetical protein